MSNETKHWTEGQNIHIRSIACISVSLWNEQCGAEPSIVPVPLVVKLSWKNKNCAHFTINARKALVLSPVIYIEFYNSKTGAVSVVLFSQLL